MCRVDFEGTRRDRRPDSDCSRPSRWSRSTQNTSPRSVCIIIGDNNNLIDWFLKEHGQGVSSLLIVTWRGWFGLWEAESEPGKWCCCWRGWSSRRRCSARCRGRRSDSGCTWVGDPWTPAWTGALCSSTSPARWERTSSRASRTSTWRTHAADTRTRWPLCCCCCCCCCSLCCSLVCCCCPSCGERAHCSCCTRRDRSDRKCSSSIS